MINVGVITLLYNNFNYGGILQAYALIRYLNDHGYNANGIKYNGNQNIVYANAREKLKQYKISDVIKKCVDILNNKTKGKTIEQVINKRKNLFISFINENIPTTDIYNDINLENLNDQFDCFISGSDQVWNPNCALYPFVQGFVEDDNKKIAYAASISRSSLSLHEQTTLGPYIRKFSRVSVREKTAVKLLESMGVGEVCTVLDPTFLLEKEKWGELVDKDCLPTNKYILCYSFSDSTKIRKIAKEYCDNNALDLVFIPYAKQEYKKKDQKGEGIPAFSIGPKEFISLLIGAEYVLTDSFHGAALSINLEKQFCVFEREKSAQKASMNSRIYDLLDSFGLNERLIVNSKNIKDVLEKRIDYLPIGLILEEKRKKSIKFLIDSLDDFDGSIKERKIVKTEHSFFAGQSDKYTANSSSGGVFSALSEKVIKDGGVVYGVGFDERFDAIYQRITDSHHICSILGSKYIQSHFSKNVSLDTVASDLFNGIPVLFSGTGCTIAALYNLLEKKQVPLENLITVEVICHGIPDERVWKAYKVFLEKKYDSTLEEISFRKKSISWQTYSFFARLKNGKIYNKIKEKNEYMQLYLSDFSVMNRCTECKYKNYSRISDITLGDLWGVNIHDNNIKNDTGISAIVVNSSKGNSVIESIKTEVKLIKLEPFQEATVISNMMGYAKKISEQNKSEFYKLLETEGFKKAYRYYRKKEWKYVLKSRVKGTVKVLIKK